MNNPEKTNIRAIITDLDGTLLHNDLTISENTKTVFEQCRRSGIYIGFATARAENAAKRYLDFLQPDIIISNGGALVKFHGSTVFRRQLSAEVSSEIIKMCLNFTGGNGEITVETDTGHYWNYKTKPDGDYSGSLFSDFSDFNEPAYKITAELENDDWADKIARRFPGCETLKFNGEIWHRFAAKGADKSSAAQALCRYLNIKMSDIAAFGDDINDLDMIKSAGMGVAVGNALAQVKASAGHITLSNDDDGVAEFIKKIIL